ncbi:hypothetical protein [Arthrobacter sp. JSM 101049]|uniref:hypothetical protein n=1 Tax=Arthrobacter sp. JSM 101049 TaxID=929097 RepID=UPI00356B5E12
MNPLLRAVAPTRREASLEPIEPGTVPATTLALVAAVLLAAGTLPAAIATAAGQGVLDGVAALAAVGLGVALVLLWPQHITALIALLLLGAAYVRIGGAGLWTLPLYVLAAHAIHVLLGLAAIGPRSTRFTRGALRAATRAAAWPQIGAQVLTVVVLLLSLWGPSSTGALGTAAGVASACVLAGGALMASRVAGRPENPD